MSVGSMLRAFGFVFQNHPDEESSKYVGDEVFGVVQLVLTKKGRLAAS